MVRPFLCFPKNKYTGDDCNHLAFKTTCLKDSWQEEECFVVASLLRGWQVPQILWTSFSYSILLTLYMLCVQKPKNLMSHKKQKSVLCIFVYVVRLRVGRKTVVRLKSVGTENKPFHWFNWLRTQWQIASLGFIKNAYKPCSQSGNNNIIPLITSPHRVLLYSVKSKVDIWQKKQQ